MRQRMQQLQQKLALLTQQDAAHTVFGAGDAPWHNILGHHYMMHPVLTEKEILASEQMIGVSLPEEYREFLKLVGNGGAGPAWGLYQLTNTHPDEDFFKEYPDFCSMEFPYENAYAEGALQAIQNDFTERGPYDEAFGGYIKLANYGHEMSAILIVSGEQRGKMWLLDEGTSLTPFYQERNGKPEGVGFLDWYETWLDQGLHPETATPQF